MSKRRVRPNVITFNSVLKATGWHSVELLAAKACQSFWAVSLWLLDAFLDSGLVPTTVTKSTAISSCSRWWTALAAFNYYASWDLHLGSRKCPVGLRRYCVNSALARLEWRDGLQLLSSISWWQLQADVVSYRSLLEAAPWKLTSSLLTPGRTASGVFATRTSIIQQRAPAGLSWQVALATPGDAQGAMNALELQGRWRDVLAVLQRSAPQVAAIKVLEP